MPQNLADCTDEELAQAIHFLDAHMDDLDLQELRAFRIIREMLLRRVASDREVENDNDNAEFAARLDTPKA